MNFTLLPDMEEKRKNRELRKEKKKRRNAEKNYNRRRKCLAKKSSFGAIFASCLVITLTLGILVTSVITILVERNEYNKIMTSYNLWQAGINNTFDYVKSKVAEGDYSQDEALYMLKSELKLAMVEYNNSELYDFAAAVYDRDMLTDTVDENLVYGSEESKEHIINDGVGLLCDSREAVCFVKYIDYNTRKIYLCPKENFGELYDEIISWYADAYNIYNNYGGDENTVRVVIEDYYVKDNTVVPGKLYTVETDESGCFKSKTRKDYDFTPDDLTGYTYYNAQEENDKFRNGEESLNLGYIFGGTRVGSVADNDIKLANVEYYDTGAVGVSFGTDGKDEKYAWFNLDGLGSLTVNHFNYKFLGKTFTVITSGYYFFYKIHSKELIIIYITVLIILVLIAFIIARFKWIKISTQYEIDDYRKTITDSMAHDLKSPLMAVSALLENLKENVHTEKRDYYVEVISENVSYMNGLIENILDLSKLENTNYKLEKEKINLNVLVNEIISKYASIISEKEIDIEKNIDLEIEGNRQLMGQAIDNLISNAIKYTDRGASVSIKTEGRVLYIVNTYPDANKLDVTELVKPFVKADKSRSNKSGSGLGLAIVKNILAEHEYKLVIEAKNEEFIAKIEFV